MQHVYQVLVINASHASVNTSIYILSEPKSKFP